jgi:hypothetical protein
VSNLDNPSSALELWIVFLLLNLLAPLLYMWDVVPVFDSFLRRFTRVALVSAQMLNGVWTFDDDLIEHEFKLAHIVSVCSGYDYR